MEHKTMYHCTGSCGGASETPGTCMAESCDMQGQPLQEVEQCDHCAAQTAEDGMPHACDMCEVK